MDNASLNRLFRLFASLFIFLGSIALFIADFLPIYFFVPFAILTIASFFEIKINVNEKYLTYFLNTIIVCIFLFFFINFIFESGRLLENSLGLLLFLKGIKIATINKHRDYLILFLLSFFEIIAATVISDDLYFVVILVSFLLISTFTFILYNLINEVVVTRKKEIDEKIISYKFFLFLVPIIFAILILTLSVFFVFPRIDVGLFYNKHRREVMTAGFTETVTLGTIGRILENKEIVMRVELEKNPYLSKEKGANLYFRGSAFDTYDGQNWSHSESARRTIQSKNGVSIKLREAENNSTLIKQNIYLSPLNTKIIFGFDRVHELEFKDVKLNQLLFTDSSVEYDPYGTIYFRNDREIYRNYIIHSDLNLPPISILLTDSNEYPQYIISKYLGLPEINRAVSALANKITEENNSAIEKVIAIERYLRLSGNYKYSLNLQKSSEEDPISDFLLFTKRGHCEYFASSMVILLRTLGIPSRVVSGFHGGEWNDVGNYLVVRQNNAHSWVEVYFSKFGWQRFDPTPPATSENIIPERHFSLSDYISHSIDYARLRWYKYIINYSLRDQMKIFSKVTGVTPSGEILIKIHQNYLNIKKRLSRWGSWEKIVVFAGLITFILILLQKKIISLSFLIKKRSKNSSSELYNAFIDFLKKRKIQKREGETLSELEKRLPTNLLLVYGAIIKKIIYYYYKTRFGKNKLNNLERIEVGELTEKLGR